MLKVQLEMELRQLIIKEKINMDRARKLANKRVGYVKPKPKCEQLYVEGWLDNKKYAHIVGLESFILNHPELTCQQITKMIKSKPISLKFLNHVLKLIPNAIEVISSDGAYNFSLKYIRRCSEIKMSKQNIIG